MKGWSKGKIRKLTVLAAGMIGAAGILAGCGSGAPTPAAGVEEAGREEASLSAEAPGLAESAEATPEKVSITNISYDPTRELYEQYNKLFADYWKAKTGQEVEIVQSHGGSGKQARSVLEGNEADVVTLALEGDVDELRKAGLIDEGWVDELAQKSSPYTSTIVFLVRKGNPKNLGDWDDLVKPGVEVITPDPKSSGGARWNFLAAWAFADRQNGGDEEKNKEFLKALYGNVTVLDSGARGSTTTFVENGQGDVLLAWENEAFLSIKEHPEEFEIIAPSLSILAQPSVTVVDENARKHGTEEVAREYLAYLYSEEAQRLEGESYYRPSNPEILKEFADVFTLDIELVNIDDDFGGWEAATEKFFADGTIFDQIYSQ
ncbi:MAG: sulfate ABC transporter substrate-binding protein [Clostridium sp.]|jgi:sulfate transport system substrate-binding protein|nr:sulfate ABC transporter substrate-binding protein [Clostridium sp.]